MIILINKHNEFVEGFASTVYITFFKGAASKILTS